MTSSIGSYSTTNRLNHTINVVKTSTLPAVHYERTISKGQTVTKQFKVKEYYTEQGRTFAIPVQEVATYQEYVAGCSLHDTRCLGHFCVTPRGSILLPQKLVSTLGVMNNEYGRMAEDIFKRDTPMQEEEYRNKLRSLMLGKSGKMRGDMAGGSVDGSMRLVISLCWQIPPNHLAIPRKLASNMRVLRISKDKDTGLPLGYYIEDCVREGDYHMSVRPPSLWAGNDQPMKIVLWDHECLGISPSNADEYHADHDGDEFQSYHLTQPESIEQCKSWKPLSKDKFEEAVRSLPLPESCYEVPINKREKFFEHLGLREKFMKHSTVSIKELQDGVKLPSIAKVSGLKEAMANMLVERLKDPSKVWEDSYSDSIRGIKDIMAQRLNQGDLGDMSRQAKLAASCIAYKGNGIFEVRTSSGAVVIHDNALQNIASDVQYPLGGNPCMRAVSSICKVAQQAALDSHRVSQEVSSNLDLVNNLIRGGPESLVVFAGPINLECSWKYTKDNQTFAIIKNNTIRASAINVIGAYNPAVLREVKMMNGNVKEVCRNGILVVCSYYGIELSMLELHALAELMCYRCGDSSEPITTKGGIRDRDLRWMTVIFANHFGVLSRLQNKGLTRRRVKPETITEAFAFGNFDYI